VKKILGNLARIAVSLLLLWLVLRKVDVSQTANIVRTASVPLLLLSLVFMVAVTVAGAWRWKILLGAQGIRLGLARLAEYNFIGMLFSNALPTTVGGDVARAYYVGRDTERTADSFAAVIADRVVGMVALICLAFMVLVVFLVLQRGQYMGDFYWIGGVLVACLVLAVLFFNRRLLAPIKRLKAIPLARRVGGRLKRLYNALYVYRHSPRTVARAFIVSFVIQSLNITAFYFVGAALHLDLSPILFFLYIPIIASISTLPISTGGWGLWENVFVFFFTKEEITSSEAFSLGLLCHLVIVANSLGGGLFLLLQRGGPAREAVTGVSLTGEEDTARPGQA
jgi:uncharacterized protein (TIRG00374 family)